MLLRLMMRAIKESLSIWTLTEIAAGVVIRSEWEWVTHPTLIERREVSFKACSSASTTTSATTTAATTTSSTPARPKNTLLEIQSFLRMTLTHGVGAEVTYLLCVLPFFMKLSQG